jgi:streptogramin lyase
MANARPTLERIRDQFVPPPGGFERLVARRERRLRIRRITAATLALALSASLFLGLWSVMRTTVPPTLWPGGALTVRVGGTPVDVAVGEGSVWVATVTDSSGRGEVVRIDLTEGRVVARISLPEVGALAVGEGSVWVANLRHETVTRIDPATDVVAEVIDMPPLPYEVAEGDRAFLPERIATGFGRVWVSTARGSVTSIDPATGEVVEVASDPQVILGGVAAGAGSVWAWNTFEPPEAEVWRISPQSAEIDRMSVPATVLDAATGSAGLYLLHVQTGDVSLVGAVDPLEGPVEGSVPVGSAGERANAIAVADPTVYVAAATGNIYAIDQGSGDVTLLTRVPGEPTSLTVAAALWVTATDGTVTEVPLEREVAPEPTVVPTPTETADEHTPISGGFYPTTYREGDQVIMPVTFVDGTRAELVFDSRLRPEDLAVISFTSGGLGEVDRTLAIRYAEERIYQMHTGPIETYQGYGGSSVEVWEGPPGEFPCPHLIFRFGNWFVAVRTCQPELSDAEKAEWARSLVGRVIDDGFLVLEARSPLVLREVGGHEGPEVLLAGEGGWPFVTLRPGPCTTDQPARNQELRVMPDGQEVLFARIGKMWDANWCEDGAMYVGVESPDRGYVEAAAEGLRIRDLSVAR